MTQVHVPSMTSRPRSLARSMTSGRTPCARITTAEPWSTSSRRVDVSDARAPAGRGRRPRCGRPGRGCGCSCRRPPIPWPCRWPRGRRSRSPSDGRSGFLRPFQSRRQYLTCLLLGRAGAWGSRRSTPWRRPDEPGSVPRGVADCARGRAGGADRPPGIAYSGSTTLSA